jgi:hypothetical protein
MRARLVRRSEPDESGGLVDCWILLDIAGYCGILRDFGTDTLGFLTPWLLLPRFFSLRMSLQLLLLLVSITLPFSPWLLRSASLLVALLFQQTHQNNWAGSWDR